MLPFDVWEDVKYRRYTYPREGDRRSMMTQLCLRFDIVYLRQGLHLCRTEDLYMSGPSLRVTTYSILLFHHRGHRACIRDDLI